MIQGWLGDAASSGLDHGELEAQLDTRGRELLRQLYQDHLELRAVREGRIEVRDSEGTRRTRTEAGHTRVLATIFGQVTGRSLTASNFVGEDGAVLTADLARAEAKLQSEVIKRMNRVDATSGYQIRIKLVDLATLPASQFVEFALLVR